MWELVETLLLALIIFVGVRSIILNYRVDGMSMEPNLQNGEMLIVNRREYSYINVANLVDWIPGTHVAAGTRWYPFRPPQRGDIIVFMPPGVTSEPYIKRIIGLPGDQISIHNGGVYVNGQRLSEPYLTSTTSWPGVNPNSSYTVQPGHVFVLGDNRNNSSDSRVFGEVPETSIIGKAWLAYWPPSVIGPIQRPHYGIR
ncbi:MAG TPA: signal peptidase I [Thermomicrobiaceae bacterium]|nr:signal peptidase I [Thermomicrobiaceae bacterium]